MKTQVQPKMKPIINIETISHSNLFFFYLKYSKSLLGFNKISSRIYENSFIELDLVINDHLETKTRLDFCKNGRSVSSIESMSIKFNYIYPLKMNRELL